MTHLQGEGYSRKAKDSEFRSDHGRIGLDRHVGEEGEECSVEAVPHGFSANAPSFKKCLIVCQRVRVQNFLSGSEAAVFLLSPSFPAQTFYGKNKQIEA